MGGGEGLLLMGGPGENMTVSVLANVWLLRIVLDFTAASVGCFLIVFDEDALIVLFSEVGVEVPPLLLPPPRPHLPSFDLSFGSQR